MVTLPAGFDASLYLTDLAELGVYIVGCYVLLLAADLVFKALRGGR